MKRLLCVLLTMSLFFTGTVFATEEPSGESGKDNTVELEDRRTSWAPSDAIIEFIANQEGFRSMPYKSGRYWYIGFGTQIKSGQYSEGITRTKARELLMKHVNNYMVTLNTYLKKNNIALTQNEFDALMSFTYNVSSTWMKNSALSTYLQKGAEHYTDLDIMNAMGVWCHAGGKVLPGLVRRRIAEVKIFLYGDYDVLNNIYYNTTEQLEMRGPNYPGGIEVDYTYICYNAGKGYTDSDIVYYRKGEPYQELAWATREGYQLASWKTEKGEHLQPTDVPAKARTVEAVWTTGEADHRNITTSPFPDVSIKLWYYDELKELKEKGIIDGYQDGKFRPNDAVTCGEVLKLVLLAAGYPEQVPTGESALSGYLTLALQEGMIEEGEITNLQTPANRLLVARLTAKAMGVTPAPVTTPYADVDDVYATALYSTGIMEGKDVDGVRILDVFSSIRRCEIVAVVWRMYHYIPRESIAPVST